MCIRDRAQGMGCAGVRVAEADELAAALRRALESEGPVLIELMVD